MPLPIEDYALIGDCQAAALVGRNGSIDWLCWPRFDSDACFAALLGTEEHGHWRIAPRDPEARVTRRYRADTLILETRFECDEGAVTLVDFMPMGATNSSVVRLVVGERGRVTMSSVLVLRFGYGAIVPWVTRLDDGTLRAVAGPDMVVLRTPANLVGQNMKTIAEFEIAAGETLPFVLTYAPSHLPPPEPLGPTWALDATEGFWTNWSKNCRPAGHCSDAVSALADHAQGLHLLADRRHRRRTDHLVAGAPGRGEKLGLSLLLAARCDADPARTDGRRVPGRGAGVA